LAQFAGLSGSQAFAAFCDHAGVEQVEPRTLPESVHVLRTCAPRQRPAVKSCQWRDRLFRRRRSYRPGHRRQVPRQQRFLHHRRRGLHRASRPPTRPSPSTWPTCSASQGRCAFGCGRAGDRPRRRPCKRSPRSIFSRSKRRGRIYRPHRAGRRARETSSPRCPSTRPTPRRRPPSCFSFWAAAARQKIPVATVAAQVHRRGFSRGSTTWATASGLLANSTRISRSWHFARQTFGLPASAQAEHSFGQRQSSRSTPSSTGPSRGRRRSSPEDRGTTWLEESHRALPRRGATGWPFVKALYREAYGRYEEMAKALSHRHFHQPHGVCRRRPRWTRSAPRIMSRRWSTTRPASASISISARWCTSASAWRPRSRRSTWLCSNPIAPASKSHVTDNILKRHIEPLFLGTGG